MVASVATRAAHTNVSCGIDPRSWAFQSIQGDLRYLKTHHGANSL
jgi:hypothetical protein